MTGRRAPHGPVVLSWSSGKDAAWALHELRRAGADVVGLLTTVNAPARRVAMHAVRTSLLRAQARAVGVPLHVVALPWPCTNDDYERLMGGAVRTMRDAGVRHVAFGDLFLEDVRRYREEAMRGTGLDPLFPLWGRDTRALAAEMQAAGVRATVTCVDPRQAPASLAGRPWDAALVAALPPGVDPCGERGEFHTFVSAGPGFAATVLYEVGEVVLRDERFAYCDLLPLEAGAA